MSIRDEIKVTMIVVIFLAIAAGLTTFLPEAGHQPSRTLYALFLILIALMLLTISRIKKIKWLQRTSIQLIVILFIFFAATFAM